MSELNKSGWVPFDLEVLVKIEPPEELKSKGGIILTSNVDAVSIEAVHKGVIVDKSDMAFKGVEDAPGIGDTVMFAKYAGVFLYPHMTNDEGTYRMMPYHDIRAKKENSEVKND